MKKALCFTILIYGVALSAAGQSTDETEIRDVLNGQLLAWNKNDIDGFMKSYWNNDSLMFVGSNGITYGYQNALNNYKKNYSSPEKMGKLFFTVLQVRRLSDEYYFVLGKWLLKRNTGDLDGHYTLLFRKINGKWVIVSDHSS